MATFAWLNQLSPTEARSAAEEVAAAAAVAASSGDLSHLALVLESWSELTSGSDTDEWDGTDWGDDELFDGGSGFGDPDGPLSSAERIVADLLADIDDE